MRRKADRRLQSCQQVNFLPTSTENLCSLLTKQYTALIAGGSGPDTLKLGVSVKTSAIGQFLILLLTFSGTL